MNITNDILEENKKGQVFYFIRKNRYILSLLVLTLIFIISDFVLINSFINLLGKL